MLSKLATLIIFLKSSTGTCFLNKNRKAMKKTDFFLSKNKPTTSSTISDKIRKLISDSLDVVYQEDHKIIANIKLQVIDARKSDTKLDKKSPLYFFFHFLIRWLKPKVFFGGNLIYSQDLGVNQLDSQSRNEVMFGFAKTFPKEFVNQLKGRYGLLALPVEMSQSKMNGVIRSSKEGGLLPTEPLMVMEMRPHWKKREDYFKDLSSKYRNRAKQVLKRSEGLRSQSLSLTQANSNEALLQQLLHNVLEKSKTKWVTPPKHYFSKLKTILPNDFFIEAYYEKNKMVGFMSFVIENEQLNAHLVGLDYTKVKEKALYNRILLDLVFKGIDHQIHTLHFGRTATEIKSTLGAIAIESGVILKSNKVFINHLLFFICRFIKAPAYRLRSPFSSNEK